MKTSNGSDSGQAFPDQVKKYKMNIESAKKDVKRLEQFLQESGQLNEKGQEIFKIVLASLATDLGGPAGLLLHLLTFQIT